MPAVATGQESSKPVSTEAKDLSGSETGFAVTAPKAVTIDRVVFAHGKSFHDDGWFDTDTGHRKPQVQVQTELRDPWRTVATLDGYPNTTSTNSAGPKPGQDFTTIFAPNAVFTDRVTGTPACGDTPTQNFASCAELQAFLGSKQEPQASQGKES